MDSFESELFDIDNVHVTVGDTHERKTYPNGTLVKDVLGDYNDCVAAIMNNVIVQLSTPIYVNSVIKPIPKDSAMADRPLDKTLRLVLSVAIERLFPGKVIQIQWEYRSNVSYWRLYGKKAITDEDVALIREEMHKIVKEDLQIMMHNLGLPEALKIFEHRQMTSNLIQQFQEPIIRALKVGDDYFEHFIAITSGSTGMCPPFEVMGFNDGLYLFNLRNMDNTPIADLLPPEHFYSLLERSLGTEVINGIGDIPELNNRLQKMMSAHNTKMITVSENALLNQLNILTNYIQNKQAMGSLPRVIFISGPSSSAKTTTSNKINAYLRGCGYNPVTFSLDEFYIDYEETKRIQGTDNPDLETITTLNIPRIHRVIRGLMCGHKVRVPKYNFKLGISEEGEVSCINEFLGKSKILETKDPSLALDEIEDILPKESVGMIVIEGIHALNPIITSCVPEELQVRVFLEPMSGIRVTDHDIISSYMVRILRRSVRDYLYRGCSIARTLKLWPGVRRGENTWIYPNSTRAHIVINTSIFYELTCLRDYALCVMSDTNEKMDAQAYSMVLDCTRYLSWLFGVSADIIPNTSVAREFFPGGSIYNGDE